MNTNNKTTQIIIALILVGVSFYGGMKYQSSKNPRGNFMMAGNFNGEQMGGRGGVRGSTGMIIGNIISKDSNGITVQMRDGGSKIVLITNETQVMKTTTGTKEDLSVGKEISGTGAVNSDGSITATSIQLRPASTTMVVR